MISSPDGPAMTAFAAQGLVAQGITVSELQALDVEGGCGDSLGPATFDVQRSSQIGSKCCIEALLNRLKLGRLDGVLPRRFPTHYTLTHPRKVRWQRLLFMTRWQGSTS